MSIQDRDWYAEEVLKKMGIIDREKPTSPGFVAFLTSYRRQVFARKRRSASWFWLFAFVLFLAVLAVLLLKLAVVYFKTST